MNEKTVVPIPPDKQLAKRFRIAAVSLLAVGLISAGLVYWKGKAPAEDIPDELATLQMRKKSDQLSQAYFGKSEGMVEGWKNDLAQPGTQAVLIIVVAGLLAWGCFHLAKLSDDS